jgi:TonB family protein
LCVLLIAPLAPLAAETQPPKLIKQVAPEYPEALRSAEITGKVVVQFGVDAAGAVVNVAVFTSDHAELNDPAVNAVKQWRFQPAMKDGQPVATALIRVPITFAVPPTAFHAYKSFADALSLAGQQHKVVLVDFFTTWCEPCKRLDAVTWQDPSVIALLREKAIAFKVDAEQAVPLASHYRVTAYPTIAVLRPDGTLIDSLVGYRDAPTFIAEFNGLLSGRTKLDEAKEAVAKAGADPEALAKARYALGQILAQKGDEAASLQEYLWCFDVGMKQAPALGGVRQSFLLRDITDLGTRYPPALDALRARRDADQSKLGDPGSAAEFASLNHYLEEDRATLAAFDRLPPGSPQRAALGYWLFDTLLEARRYNEAAAAMPAAQFKAQFEEMRSTPNQNEALRAYFITAGAKEVEALAGAGHLEEARDLATRLAAYDPSAADLAALQEHLKRAGHPELMPQAPGAPVAGKT